MLYYAIAITIAKPIIAQGERKAKKGTPAWETKLTRKIDKAWAKVGRITALKEKPNVDVSKLKKIRCLILREKVAGLWVYLPCGVSKMAE
eukprot:3716217-Ditylum_brightwellii.AAC.1